MFGRRRKEEEAREAERRALFAELAKRPDTVCPFLGLADARAEYREGVSDDHRCYAFGDPAELSAEQQTKVCLQRGYGNCPRYLRGVLVIPTEELEALRRPQPEAAPAPPPPASPRGGRRWGLVLAFVLLLAIGGGGAAFVLLGNGFGVAAGPTATPTPRATPSPEPSILPSVGPSVLPSEAPTGTPKPTRKPTPIPLPSVGPTIPPLPTPGPGDTATGYAIFVAAGHYPVLLLDTNGTELADENGAQPGDATAIFDHLSPAPVDRIVLADGIYWRTLLGDYTGYSYNRTLSGDGFTIYQTFENASGEPRFRQLDPSEY